MAPYPVGAPQQDGGKQRSRKKHAPRSRNQPHRQCEQRHADADAAQQSRSHQQLYDEGENSCVKGEVTEKGCQMIFYRNELLCHSLELPIDDLCHER